MEANMEHKRQRRFHNRSRQGCITCRQRHVRCDEIRPVCGKCAKLRKKCEYGKPQLSVDEQRWSQMELPGVSVWQVTPTAPVVDPFESLPIKMPFKSQELLRYFFGAKSCPTPSPPKQTREPSRNIPEQDSLALAVRDAMSLRSSLLMAAIHYSWQTGHLEGFERCFFLHKHEMLLTVNGWMTKDAWKLPIEILRLIAILSISESCIGNYPVAEAHLQGLLTILELRDSQRSMLPDQCSDPTVKCDTDEILERLVLVAYNFSSAVKSRLKDTLTADEDYSNIWQRSFTSISENLASLRLIPYYFSMELQPYRNEVDGQGVVNGIRGLTEAVSKRHTTNEVHHVQRDELAPEKTICDSQDPTTCTGCRGFGCLVYAYTEGHASTLKPTQDKDSDAEPVLRISWRGLAAAGTFYLNSVLRLWNAGEPMGQLLYTRLMRSLMADVQATMNDQYDVSARGDLWFWKVFVGAHVLLSTALSGESWVHAAGHWFDETKEWFYARILSWSLARGVFDWNDAEEALHAIVWPTAESMPTSNELARQIWNEATMMAMTDPQIHDLYV